MLQLSKIYYKYLFYFAALLPLIPNFGNLGLYNAVRVIFTIVFGFVFLHAYSIRFTGVAKQVRLYNIVLILILIFGLLMVEMFSNYGVRLEMRDVFELYKPFYSLFLFVGFISLFYLNYKNGNNIHKMFMYSTILVSVGNLIVTWSLYYASLPFSGDINPYYTVDNDVLYSTLRATGLPGQPGTTSNYTAFLTISLLWVNTRIKNPLKTTLVLSAILCNIMASLITYSRIGLAINILGVLYYLFSNYKRLLPYSIVFMIIFSVFSDKFINNSEFINMDKLTRDTDGDVSSITSNRSTDARLWSRNSAEIAALQNPVTTIFGVGPKKTLLSNTSLISEEVAQRSNQLWSPDSDYAVFVSRYGFLGMFFHFLPFLIILYNSYQNFSKNDDFKFLTFFVGIILFVSQLDPPLNDLRNTHIIYQFIAILLVYCYIINPKTTSVK